MARVQIAIPIVGMLDMGRMQRELTMLLKRPVDLVLRDGLKPLIRENVLASTEVIYAVGRILEQEFDG